MQHRRLALSVLLWGLAGAAQAEPNAMPISGQVRVQHDELQANLALAGPARLPTGFSTLETELRASGLGLTTVVTLQQRQQADAGSSRAWVNEFYASHDGGAWQLSAGKKIVSWDVGYGFRPNDMVQQEARRSLVATTPEGRPLLLAEHFNADTAWSVVWVNPTGAADDASGNEPAVATRFYKRHGAVDWYGFARSGVRVGSSAGAAMAWVASDALELHGSVRYLNRGVKQALVGGTWTTQSQVSLLAEAWWDGTAALQRNLMLRMSWQHEGWQPVLDVLYTPQDRGRVVTGSLAWQGDRVQVQGGVRVYGGPPAAQWTQLPVRSQAYAAVTWSF